MTLNDEPPPFPPLTWPEPWPPPEEPPAGAFERVCWWIPVLGWPFALVAGQMRIWRHIWGTLEAVESRICDQLEPRPEARPRDGDTRPTRISCVISKAIALEKGVAGTLPEGAVPHRSRYGPALHPEDPMPLLMWGPFEDFTPAILREEYRKAFGLSFPRDDDCVVRAWDERWTVARFVAEIDRRCGDRSVSPHEPTRRAV